MTIILHHGDLPADFKPAKSVAVDTETMGLNIHRDRLCLVQISNGDGIAHLVKFSKDTPYDKAVNLKKIIADPNITKMFHFARFDINVLQEAFGVTCAPVYCTKIASRIARTYTDRHGLRDVCRELLGIDLNKQQQSSDWGADELSEDQKSYAANDVYHLHQIRAALDIMLQREGRSALAQKCFDFLHTRVELDNLGWYDGDFFSH